jgi:hypothetical protein
MTKVYSQGLFIRSVLCEPGFVHVDYSIGFTVTRFVSSTVQVYVIFLFAPMIS